MEVVSFYDVCWYQFKSGSKYNSSDEQFLMPALDDLDTDKDIVGAYYNQGEPILDWFDYDCYYLHEPFFLDIETNGLIKNPTDYATYPRIIQIAFATGKSEIINNYVIPESFTISKEIEELTGITNTLLLEKGVPIQRALSSLCKKENRSPIVTYNADFDLSVIDSENLRLENKSINYFGNPLRDGSQVFCLMKKINSIVGGKYLKLSEAYTKFFDEPFPVRPHNAINDLEITVDLFYLLKLYGYIRKGNKGRILI